jgi:aconitate hydratase 2/2-methylisocitrate dehydratase
MFDAFYDVESKAKAGNKAAQKVMESWAAAEWFTAKPAVPEKISVTVFKVTHPSSDSLSSSRRTAVYVPAMHPASTPPTLPN